MIQFRPVAAREFAADYAHYEVDRRGRGIRFVAAVNASLARIEAAPLRFPLVYEPDIRSAKVKRFRIASSTSWSETSSTSLP